MACKEQENVTYLQGKRQSIDALSQKNYCLNDQTRTFKAVLLFMLSEIKGNMLVIKYSEIEPVE